VQAKATPFFKERLPRRAVSLGAAITHASPKTRNELWPKKAQKFQPATKIAAQTWPRFCHQIASNPATGLMPSDMSRYPRTNTASRPSEASTIGKDLTITGDVTSNGELRIDGRVQGNVHCLSLILGENAEIKGDVKAEDVLIGGRLLGSVRGRRVMLQSHVEGDLLHKDLAMEPGAYFQGESRRAEGPLTAAQPAQKQKVTAEPQQEHSEGRKDTPPTSFIRSLQGADSI
jgi:cytoskeletal protein CcmA (bactofilin family)